MENLIRFRCMEIGSTNPRTGTRDGNHSSRAHTTDTMAGAGLTDLHYRAPVISRSFLNTTPVYLSDK